MFALNNITIFATGNRVKANTLPRVRIPISPPYKNANIDTMRIEVSVFILHTPAVKRS